MMSRMLWHLHKRELCIVSTSPIVHRMGRGCGLGFVLMVDDVVGNWRGPRARMYRWLRVCVTSSGRIQAGDPLR